MTLFSGAILNITFFKVNLYMVPMFTRAIQLTPAIIDKMDVLSQKVSSSHSCFFLRELVDVQIIPKIDGIRCVKEIAMEVEIDPDLVMRCVR